VRGDPRAGGSRIGESSSRVLGGEEEADLTLCENRAEKMADLGGAGARVWWRSGDGEQGGGSERRGRRSDEWVGGWILFPWVSLLLLLRRWWLVKGGNGGVALLLCCCCCVRDAFGCREEERKPYDSRDTSAPTRSCRSGGAVRPSPSSLSVSVRPSVRLFFLFRY